MSWPCRRSSRQSGELNHFSYAENSPTNFRDPWGFTHESVVVLFVRRAGCLVLGLSLVIFGFANLSLGLRLQFARWWHLWFALLVISELVCLISLAIQWKEKDFAAPS